MQTASPPDDLLAPFDGTREGSWTPREAAHLLARTQFGFSEAELDRAVKVGCNATIERLLTPQVESAEFQQSDSALKRTALATGNISDLKIWWLYRMWASANPLTEKVALFWHNHFATSNDKVTSVPMMLIQNELIRQHGLSDFKKLLHGMSRDPAMLVWLDGNANRKRHPNENFAREIMELFALGVGNYSERDIQEAARSFSGWHVREGTFWFNQLQHDDSPKTVFGKSGNFDGTNVVNLCLAEPACPRFLAMKLLKTFVCSDPTAEMIAALASRIRLHDYAMASVLRELFQSKLFFDAVNRRSLIKSPLDFVVGSLRSLAATVKWPPVVKVLAELGQDIFQPPSVKGWEGGRMWVNSSTILMRANFATEVVSGEQICTLSKRVEDGAGASTDSVVTHLERLLLESEVAPALHAELSAQHQKLEGSATQKLRSLVQLIMSLPEYNLF